MPEKNKSNEFTIDKKLVLVRDHATGREDIIRKLGSLLLENGFVKDSFTNAVLEREIAYPTGLKARVTGVAVPHTDTEHVIKPAVAIATLENPVVFKGMGAPDTEVEVNIVLMLAIHNPKEVVNVLRKIIFIIEDDDAMRRILDATQKEKITEIMNSHILALSGKLGS